MPRPHARRQSAHVILDNNQHFEYNLDTTMDVNNFSVVNSPENAEMLRFQRKTSQASKDANEWSKKRKEFEDFKYLGWTMSHRGTVLFWVLALLLSLVAFLCNIAIGG